MVARFTLTLPLSRMRQDYRREGTHLKNDANSLNYSNNPMEPSTNWKQTLHDGDRDSFEGLVEPYLDDLMKAGRLELLFYADHERLHRDDFTAEEVAGETLIQAWEHRHRVPEQISLRGWLLATQHRILLRLVEGEEDYRHSKAISLDDELPNVESEADPRERFSELYAANEPNTWGSVTPGSTPVDYEVSLDEERPSLGEVEGRHVLMMHDEFDMTPEEVAFTMQRAVDEVSKYVEAARTTAFERGEQTPPEPTDEPAKPRVEER